MTTAKERRCDLCEGLVCFPEGYWLDSTTPSWAAQRDEAEVIRVLRPGSVVKVRTPGFFACDRCVEALHERAGVTPDPLGTVMSRNCARYLWETGKWEKPMRRDEYPPTFPQEELLASLEQSLRNSAEELLREKETNEEGRLAIVAECLARCMQVHRCAPITNPYRPQGRTFVVISAQLPSDTEWSEFVPGFVERRMLDDVSASTRVYCAPYGFPAWFPHYMEASVAVALVLRLGENLDGVSYLSYLDSDDHRCLVVLGPVRADRAATGGCR